MNMHTVSPRRLFITWGTRPHLTMHGRSKKAHSTQVSWPKGWSAGVPRAHPAIGDRQGPSAPGLGDISQRSNLQPRP